MTHSINRRLSRLFACFLTLSTICLAQGSDVQSSARSRGVVEVRGKDILRDGRKWIPHGFYQIAFEVAPGNLARADKRFWATAYNNYTPSEYTEMREAGADSVRIQVAPMAADPQSDLFDKVFFQKAMGAVRAAREAGLTVMLCVQDESHVQGVTPIDYPDDGTRRVWQQMAPLFARDHGVMYELLNEPRPTPSQRNWKEWKATSMATLRTVRSRGANNVVIADGLAVGNVIDGAPLLDDPQVVYAAHPYALKARGQTRRAWDEKFGNFSKRAPVIITEWIAGSYYCDADTPASTVDFLHYLQEHGVGLEIGAWDWGPTTFGSVRQGFPQGKVASYLDGVCHQPYFGPGKLIETWYKTGVPAQVPQ